MNKFRSNIWFGVTIVFAVCLIMFSLYHIVLRPSHIVPELGGDGAKNNFTYLYQCQWGKGYWFDGMNYPYGEHIVYTDGQPLLSVPFTHFKNVTPGDALTVMWLLIGFSYVLSILFVYKILVRFKVAPFAAMLFAGLICILTPQILRLQGHYALSYTCVIPMLFYWTIKYREHAHWRFPVYFFITGCLMSFLHPYYAAMMFVWVVSYSIGYFIFTKVRFLDKIKHIVPLVLSVVFVLALVGAVMKTTDPVSDRPVAPVNTFYETCTRLRHIVTSNKSPVWEMTRGTKIFSHVSGEGPEGYGEGYTYVGLVVAITIGVCFIIGTIKSFRQKRLDILVESTGFSPIWLLMALVALLFGMGAPFIWHMEWLFDYISFFKQFRSLGRFSWIFYYIIAIYTAVVLYYVFAKYIAQKRFFPAYTVLLLSLGLWSYEASGYIKYTRFLSWLGIYNYDIIYSSDGYSWPVFLDQHHYGSNNFQAILVLPFFHVGTEKLWVGEPGWMITLGSKAALQLHLPMIDVMMSRSSWSQAMKQVKTAGGPFTDKPLLRDIKSNKAFLVLKYEGDTLNPDQKYLLQASDYIGYFSQCHVYACYPERITANDKKYADSVERILPFMHHADTIIGNNGVSYINHLDVNNGKDFIFGTGGAIPIVHNDSILAAIPLTIIPRDSQQYEFSCWFLLGDKDYKSPYVTLQILNDSGRVIGYPAALTKQSTDNRGMWFRASSYFYVHSNCRFIRVKLMNIPFPAYLAMDEMLLRSADAMVISKDADGKVMVNNHLYKKSR